MQEQSTERDTFVASESLWVIVGEHHDPADPAVIAYSTLEAAQHAFDTIYTPRGANAEIREYALIPF